CYVIGIGINLNGEVTVICGNETVIVDSSTDFAQFFFDFVIRVEQIAFLFSLFFLVLFCFVFIIHHTSLVVKTIFVGFYGV
ncbi:MAG: hypothetical protein IJJ55_01545, partial [Clostridia bacterium]|nr:hypothetical protein [Clostridia bacterium]